MAGETLILIVDDNRDFCDNLRDIAELKGYRALTAYDGAEALRMASAYHPHLVVMDVRMPGMDGVTAFRKLRQSCPRTQVILVSGFSVEEIAGRAVREGAVGFLKKPIDHNELFAIIERNAGNGERHAAG